MKMLTFAGRNTKEILRDPINLFFGLGFPLVLILLLTAIQANVPVPLFEIAHLAPGVTVFGLSFLTLFSAALIAKDRGSSLLRRLYTTPLTAADFILGYNGRNQRGSRFHRGKRNRRNLHKVRLYRIRDLARGRFGASA